MGAALQQGVPDGGATGRQRHHRQVRAWGIFQLLRRGSPRRALSLHSGTVRSNNPRRLQNPNWVPEHSLLDPEGAERLVKAVAEDGREAGALH